MAPAFVFKGYACVGSFWGKPAHCCSSRMLLSKHSTPCLRFLAPFPAAASSPGASPRLSASAFCFSLSTFLHRLPHTPKASVTASKVYLTSSAVMSLQTSRLHLQLPVEFFFHVLWSYPDPGVKIRAHDQQLHPLYTLAAFLIPQMVLLSLPHSSN